MKMMYLFKEQSVGSSTDLPVSGTLPRHPTAGKSRSQRGNRYFTTEYFQSLKLQDTEGSDREQVNVRVCV